MSLTGLTFHHGFDNSFSRTEDDRLFTEDKVFSGDVTGEEVVDTISDVNRLRDNTINTGNTVKNVTVIRKIIKNGEIVFNGDDVVVGVISEFTDDTGSSKTLLNIEVRSRFIDEVKVTRTSNGNSNSETLEFTTGEFSELTLEKVA